MVGIQSGRGKRKSRACRESRDEGMKGLGNLVIVQGKGVQGFLQIFPKFVLNETFGDSCSFTL